ncbi:MAG: glycoside hydrolase family 3 N-terminal domain-containing protein [Anaerolineae bacterium]
MRNRGARGERHLRLTAAWLLLALLLAWIQPIRAQEPQPGTAEPAQAPDGAWLDEMMAGMSPADKVGQLFLVTFRGDDVSAASEVAHLVQDLRIGGFILSPASGNFTNAAPAPAQVLSVTSGLQELAFTESAPVTVTHTVPVTVTVPRSETPQPSETGVVTAATVVTFTEVVTLPAQSIPLLIAVTQEGDGFPYTDLRDEFTSLPSAMALGATWDVGHAEAAGQIVGGELSAVGVNFLLGPSLDVLSDPRPGQGGDLGTRVFGGDPYWVGQMGQAYIRGVHLGSEGRVVTVGKHLPGLGASDRSLEQEIATVDKSLQELRLIELPPFFAVTQGDVVTDTVDALMTAHIRYRGFQGDIRYVTKPISLNPQALQQIMSQSELVPWRQAGGVLVSDSLGVPAVRRHYSPELDSFPQRQIALDAFQAGNDLLNLSRFSLNDSWPDQMANIEDTVLFFRSRYEIDDTFRARVDESVRRILKLKRRMCPDFSLESCTGSAEALVGVGEGQMAVAQMAQDAVTLLYPSRDELALRLPRPPRLGEDLIVFTDAREVRECELCPPMYLLDPQVVRDTILRLYGPDASDQVDPDRISAHTFAELRSFLAFDTPDLGPALREADWIVFAMLDVAAEAQPSSTALKDFLKEWRGGLENKSVVVLAYGAPYYLDTTEVSKLTAYYGIYSKTDPFVDASVRALFQEFPPQGKSPVTVDGVDYDLAEILSPDANQEISVDRADKPPATEGTPEPVELEVGDSVRVRTSVIVDHNGNPVPDGTPVTFVAYYLQEQVERRQMAATVDGVAEATITLELAGEIEIRAISEPAINSRPLVVIMGDTTVFLTPTPTSTPTPTPTSTPTATPTSTPTATPTLTPTPTPTVVVEVAPPPPPEPRVRWLDLVLALLGMAAAAAAVFFSAVGLGFRTNGSPSPVRLSLWSGVCGLAGYLFYGIGLPGSRVLEGVTPGVRGLIIGLVCGLLPLAYAIVFAWRGRRVKEPAARAGGGPRAG